MSDGHEKRTDYYQLLADLSSNDFYIGSSIPEFRKETPVGQGVIRLLALPACTSGSCIQRLAAEARSTIGQLLNPSIVERAQDSGAWAAPRPALPSSFFDAGKQHIWALNMFRQARNVESYL
jgi:hypothetical protein